MTLLDTVNVGETDYGVQSRVPMGTCATPAGSEVKVCAFADNFSLSVGNLIAVTFTYANTYGDGSTTYPKLTINGTQYPVKFPTGEYASDGAWANGQAVTFMFDGTNLLITTLPVANEVALNNMYSVSSNAVAQALGNKLNNTKTLLLNSRITGSTANLSDSIANYKYLLVRFQTNVENDFMLIPVSANYNGSWYAKTLMISEDEGQLTDFTYKSTCTFSFSSNTQITQKVFYNNVNWQLRIQAIWGIN